MTDVIVIFHFGPFFALLPLLEKWKFQKNEKKSLEISSFYTSVPKLMIICYTVPEIWHVMDVILIFHFGLFFFFLLFYPHNSPKNQNFKKMKKTPGGDIIILPCVPKIMIRWCTVLEIWCATDGQTDRWTEKVTQRGGCPT